MSEILVTGATGRHGGSGAFVARRLQQLGHRVRILVRQQDERSEALAGEGFDVRFGDLRDRNSLLPVMEGIERATFCYPVDAGIVEAAACFSSALRALAPEARVVVMSMRMAQAASPSHLGRAAWLAEELMVNAGLRLNILRVAALFYENLLLLHGESIRQQGLIRNSFGAAVVPWIAAEDAAELMVAALLRADGEDGGAGQGPVSYPPGAERLSHAQVAELLQQELGRPVAYEALSMAQWQAELLALSANGRAALNPDMARHIAAIGAALAAQAGAPGPAATHSAGDAAAPEDALAELIGRPPLSLRDYLRRMRPQLSS